jgi:hypothetical protein
MSDSAIFVGQQLKLNVTRALDKPFRIDVGIAEAALRHGPRAAQSIAQFRFVARRQHANAGWQSRWRDAGRFIFLNLKDGGLSAFTRPIQ